MTWRRVMAIGLAASLLTACTVSMSGGLLGALASVGLALLVFLLAGATQTGCIEDPPTRDDAMVDEPDVGPCLSDAHIGPCLGAPFDDATVGPCLSRLPPDAGPPDANIGPCLGAPLDAGVEVDFGPCLQPDALPPDALPPDALPPDARVGPCLESPPEPEPDPPGKAMRSIDTGAVFAKVAASLPPDVAARLVRPRDDA